MTVYTSDAVIVFFPVTDRPHGDRDVRRDALHSREVLAASHPGTKVLVPMTGCQEAAVVPIDGQGRTVPGLLTADGLLGRNLWERFARTEPEMVLDRQLWEQSGHGKTRVQTSDTRLVLDVTRRDTESRKVELEAAYPRYSPDLLADLATTGVEEGTLPLNLRWPEPFGDLFPGAAAVEAMVDLGNLTRVLALASEGRRREALAKADTALGQRRYDVTMPSLGVFWQIARVHDGEDSVLFDAEGSLDIEAPDWKALKSDERFLERVRTPTVMPFLVGMLGYIWWQVVEALRAGYVPRCCKACGRLLPAQVTVRRRFCSRSENLGCWRRRHRAAMKRRRLGGL